MENSGQTPEQAFGSRLREERDRRGWRLEDLAGHMAAQGLTRHESFYAKIETGATRVKLNEAVAIARALGLSLSQMTTYVDHDKLTRELDDATQALHTLEARYADARMAVDYAAHEYGAAASRRNDVLAALEAAGRKPVPDSRAARP
jgi:transcriptional regulator with XRE-family HTH domain